VAKIISIKKNATEYSKANAQATEACLRVGKAWKC